MFDLVRNHKRWMLFLVLLLILPSFVFFGIEGYSRFMEGDQSLAKVDGESVTQAEFDAVRRNQLDRARQMMGASFDPAVFDTPEMRRQTLDQLIDSRVIANIAVKNNLTISDNALRREIASIPAIQQNGRFDPELYAQVLAAQGMTSAGFEAGIRREMALGLVLQPVQESGLAPLTVTRSLLEAMDEKRTVRTREFAAADFRAGLNVTDADVQQYYEANSRSLELPDAVDAQYLVLNRESVLKNITVNDNDIAQYYEQNKARYSQPETRRVSHILITAAPAASEDERRAARQKAEDLASRAKLDPSQFATLARENSQDPGTAPSGGDLDWIGRGMMVPAFEEVAFTLKDGEVSDVVQTDFGFHVIKVDAVRPAQIKPLAEVRDEVAAEIRNQLAAERFGVDAGKLTDLVYDQIDSLQPAADALNLPLQTTVGVTRDAAPAGSPAVLNDPRVRQALFSNDVMREQRNSGVIELAPDLLVVVRAAKVVPAHVPPLAEVSTRIREQLLDARAAKAAAEAGEAALKALRAGGTPEGFGPAMEVSRGNPGDLGAPVLSATMQAPTTTLPAYVGADSGGRYVLVQIDAAQPGVAPAEDVLKAERTGLGRAWAEAESQAVLAVLRTQNDVTMEPAAAQALAGDAND